MEKVSLFILTMGYGFIAMFLSTIVHESGHAIAGVLQGWKFMQLVVGPFKLYRNDIHDRIHFGLEKNPVLWCGIGGAVPSCEEDADIEIFGRTLLAGPLASVILGIIVGIPGILTRSLFLLTWMAVSVGLGLFNMIPGIMSTGILFNDGSRYYRIRKGGQEKAEEEAIFKCAMRVWETEELYRQEYIDAMLASERAEFRYLGHYYALLNAKSSGDETALKAHRELMEKMEKTVPSTIRDLCVIE